jgi:hypothetical protein
MRHITSIIAALALTAFVGATAASAAPGDTYKVKKAACKAKADQCRLAFISSRRTAG